MDNRRLILLLVFSFSLVMLWDGWQKHNKPPVPAVAATADSAAGVPTPTPGATAAGAPALPGQNATAAPAAAAAPKAIIRTDVLVAEVSAQGGDIIRLELTRHKASEDPSRNYVLFDNGEKHNYAAQTGLIGNGLPNHKSVFNLAASSLELKDGEDAVTLRLDAPATADGIKVSKFITFHRGSYVADVSYEIVNGSAAALAPHAYFQFTRDGKPAEQPGGFGVQTFTGPAFYTEAEKYQKVAFEDIASKKAKFVSKASDGWAAMVQHYFVAGWAPNGKIADVDHFLHFAQAFLQAFTHFVAYQLAKGLFVFPKFFTHLANDLAPLGCRPVTPFCKCLLRFANGCFIRFGIGAGYRGDPFTIYWRPGIQFFAF